MTEQIKHCDRKELKGKCSLYANANLQDCIDCNRALQKPMTEHDAKVKADAIDEYKESLCKKLEECQTGFNMVSMANIWHYSREVAEQLKENNR